MNEGDWVWCAPYHSHGKIIEKTDLWDQSVFRVWLPHQETVVRISSDQITAIQEIAADPSQIIYIAAAARIADVLTQDVLLAPIESSVIPLPHQIRALKRAISNDRVRYLLADEVGLGKTIEAGLIMRELKLRGLVSRTLVVAPKGLVAQWISEMDGHLGERFQPVIPSDMAAYRRLSDSDNLWRIHDQVVCSLDSVKPLDSRQGWTDKRVAEYNRERFEDLTSAGWDLIIVDEAHRLGGSTDQIARFKLGQGLSEAATHLLFLSATPHQGKTDAFRRLMSLVDVEAFPNEESVTRDRVKPYVIRTEKRRAIDAEGGQLFKPRRTQLIPISWASRQQDQKALYAAVTEYVRLGYNQAIREKKGYLGFLMLLMQRLVVSSTRAIRTTLERRLEALQLPGEQLSLFPAIDETEWTELDGQDQLDTLLMTRLKALDNERAEVELLLETACRCEAVGADAKAETLLNWIYRLQQEESDPDLKILVFTEFVPTQEMLVEFLSDRGFQVVHLNGSMDFEARRQAQERFADTARIMVSTDAGGEGLNLQFCHAVVNYDIPWNPMRLEQRIGRVDRIGQPHIVRAINFLFEDSVEYRVREVLEQKLAVIFEEFGIDKTGDVLDSAQAGDIFEDLFVEAILHPDTLETSVETAIDRFQNEAREAQSQTAVLTDASDLDPEEARRILSHPFPYWVEQMTVHYLKAHGGSAVHGAEGWHLTWPDGSAKASVVFQANEAVLTPRATHMSFEHERIRGLATQNIRFVPGQPMPVVSYPGLQSTIHGYWSLWRIALGDHDTRLYRICPVFIHDDARSLPVTARHVWDQLITGSITVEKTLFDDSHAIYKNIYSASLVEGKPIYQELTGENRRRIDRDREKGAFAFEARRRAIARIGLPSVREYRLRQLETEEQAWRESLSHREQVTPDFVPLTIIRVEGIGVDDRMAR